MLSLCLIRLVLHLAERMLIDEMWKLPDVKNWIKRNRFKVFSTLMLFQFFEYKKCDSSSWKRKQANGRIELHAATGRLDINVLNLFILIWIRNFCRFPFPATSNQIVRLCVKPPISLTESSKRHWRRHAETKPSNHFDIDKSLLNRHVCV